MRAAYAALRDRYDHDPHGNCYGMGDAQDGAFVLFEDYAKLRDALRNYGGHAPACTSDRNCDCGWQLIVEELL